jgi:hypothetical protein
VLHQPIGERTTLVPPNYVGLAVAIDIDRSHDLPARIWWLVVDSGRSGHRGSIHEPDCNPASAALKKNIDLAVSVKITSSNGLPG